MTDSKFTAEYKNSVSDVIENVILPTDYKSKILSVLREQAKNAESEEPAETTDLTTTQEGEIKNTPEATPDSSNIIPFKAEKSKNTKRYIGILSSIAAAIVIITAVFLVKNMGADIVSTKDFNFSISSATNLANISDAKVTFKDSKGEIVKDKKGNPVTAYTDKNGNVSVSLPEADGYIALISADGYIPYEGRVNGSHIYVSPVMDENTYRAVLTWENTCDLDAILTVTHNNKTEQLYYFNSNIYDENDELIATLDTDSSVAGAPETITFNATEDGIFRFSVASYSALTTNSKSDLGTSKATVTLYKGDKVVDTFEVTPDTTDNVWCVFEVKNSEVQIIDNTYSVNAIPEVY